MIYIITGTSSGIGLALAQFYLEKGEKVIGISRSNSLLHKNFTFIECDLSNKEQLHDLSLSQYISTSQFPIRLINNAGIIGEIKRSNELHLTHYVDMAMTNIVAPQYLISYILSTFGLENVDTIVNITSGAGQYPVASWGAYCSSKAAIDLFARTLHEEIKELGGKTKIFNIAPGVVNTNIQQIIRNSNTKNFSRWQEFVDLYEHNELRTPKETAELIAHFIHHPPSEEEGIIHRV